MMPADREARGFTLIELIILIGILAIIAAFAYPRLVMLETEARIALVKSLGGAVNAAAREAHYLWQLKDRPAAISMQGRSITMLNGYPDEASINDTLMDYSGFQFKTKPAPARFRRTDAVQPNNCMVTYGEAKADARPAIVAYTSGC